MTRLLAVTFDLDGTLYANGPYVQQLVRRWFWRNLEKGFLNTFRAVRAARAFQRARDEIRARGPVADLHAEQFVVAARLSGYSEEFVGETIRDLIYANPFDDMAGHVFPGVSEALQVFKARGLKLAVLSDYPVDRKMKSLGLAEAGWDVLMSSEEVNALKPNPALFSTACERLGVDPAAALHVGDRADCDVAGARAAGMRSLLFTGGQPHRKGPKADFEASNYGAVKLIVESLVG